MKYKKTLFFPLGIFCIFASVYAANTLIENIRGNQIATGPSAYPTQQVRTINTGDLRFMNKDNDTLRTGDYFSGYYYDSVYGIFRTDMDTTSAVRIGSVVTGVCPAGTYTGYKLTGFSYNPEFWFMDFDYDATRYAYICIPNTTGQLWNTLSSYLGGYAYSPLIGFQNFSGIQVESSVIIGSGSLTQSARQIKILGLTSSQTSSETATWQFLQDIRLLGKNSKTELRKKIQENVAQNIKGISSFATSGTITDLSGTNGWQTATSGTPLLKGEARYFAPSSVGNISISGTNLEGNKTLIVEGGNIYITGDIRWSGILWLVALSKNWQGWNIYIHPSVTDVHALVYADRSVISYNGAELDGTVSDETLANQLYIKGSLFSENTLGGFGLVKCPFYVTNTNCNTSQKAAKYDLNYLRRYILVQPVDALGLPVGPKTPQFQTATNGLQSFAGWSSRWSRNVDFQDYAIAIEYDSRVQQNPPSIFK